MLRPRLEFMFDLTLCHSKDRHPRILMLSGSWQFPGTTLIHLYLVWVQERLSQIRNLVIANYILKTFCFYSLPRPGPSYANVGNKKLLTSPPPQHHLTPQHQTPAPEVASRSDETTGRGREPASCHHCNFPAASSQLSEGICCPGLLPARLH